MELQISKIRKSTSGITFQNTWKIRYWKDGIQKIRNTYTKDIDEAIKIRDAFYAELKAMGATEVLVGTASPKAQVSRTQKNPSKHIYERKPFLVKIRNQHVGVFDTREEAEKARDRYLKNR